MENFDKYTKEPDSVAEAYQQYKDFAAEFPDFFNTTKETVQKIIQEKQLFSCMSDSKWLKLFFAVHNNLPFLPPMEMRCITDVLFEKPDPYYPSPPREEPRPYSLKLSSWPGDWCIKYDNWEDFRPLYDIQWITVRPQLWKYIGRLMPLQLIKDETAEFRAILDHLHIFYEEIKHTFVIYGYKNNQN